MLKYNFNRLFTLKGIKSKPPFLIKAGLTRNVAARISSGNIQRLSLNSMEKLCIAFKCTPNELFDWHPDNPELVKMNIPLVKLLPYEVESIDLTSLAAKIPLEKVSEFRERLAALTAELAGE